MSTEETVSKLYTGKPIGIILTWVLNQGKEYQLTEVSDEGDVENSRGLSDQAGAIEERVSNSIHWMGGDAEHAIEGKTLLQQEEEITPV